MVSSQDDELTREVESFREELRARSDKAERERLRISPLDVPAVDVSKLELREIRALIAQRFENSRLRRRLADAERRLSSRAHHD